MSCRTNWWSGVMAVAALMIASNVYAGRASTDLSDMDDEIRALVAKERTRVQGFKSQGEKETEKGKSSGSDSSGGGNTRKNSKGGLTGGCNMDVGNTESRPGSVNSKPKPVIITGPVVQLCK